MPPTLDVPSSPTTDTDTMPPSTPSGDTSPILVTHDDFPPADCEEFGQQKKKKKKKSKKKKTADLKPAVKDEERQVLCISRNKHWRYISSYHGPWLQLPLELLESLLILNLEPATLTPEATVPRLSLPPHRLLPPTDPSKPPKPTPPPIDPGVFRSVTQIRRLIDEAAELSVRASSGLSTSELGSLLSPPTTPTGHTGRTVSMSAMRIHRLRALSVQKLAQAYKLDEIASSVMIMQGGSIFDDLAPRVLKVDPTSPDALYVHFFHEKIPSRQLKESTTTGVLDALIAAHPARLEYYRTRGIVHCFRDEYGSANRDFTHAIKEARAVRRHRVMVGERKGHDSVPTSSRKKKKGGKMNGQAPPDGTSPMDDTDADPIEPQLLFLRGAAHLQHAVFLIESTLPSLSPADQIHPLLKKTIRDHEKFLSFFSSLPPLTQPTPAQLEHAYHLSAGRRSPSPSPSPPTYTTYHPLLVESHYTLLLAYLMLGDFRSLVGAFARAGRVVDGLEGYPVFLPPRSMAQAEFVEVLERVAGEMGGRIEPPPSTEEEEGEGEKEYVRLLLAPILKRQAERGGALSPSTGKKPTNGSGNGNGITIPLHGPRVEVILAWLGGVLPC